ncbi:MAG TPA: MmgE/PrpD family protein [Acidimicrobiales bacterium]
MVDDQGCGGVAHTVESTVRAPAEEAGELAPNRATAARQLARFARDIYAHGAPESVTGRAAEILVDQLGLQIGCARLAWCEAVHDYVCSVRSEGPSTVLVHGARAHPEVAAFANATFGHGQDFDDTCMKVQTHAGAVVVPVALAVGEAVGAHGSELVRAIVAGLEVMLRAAHAVSPDCLRRGHHTPPAAGPFGAAVAAGLLMGFDEDELVRALAIAGSFSGGLIEYTQGGGSVKRIHTAIPTTAGIRAAHLARAGLTGPETVLCGTKGFCRVFADDPRPGRLTDGLGATFLIEDVGLKAYNCCYFIHSPLEALLAIVREQGLRPEEIASIAVGTSAHGTVHVGSIPEPIDALGAQFSTHFTLALALLREPPSLDSYGPEQLEDREVRELARRVTVHEDPIATAEYPTNWGANVTVTTVTGGRYERRVRYPLGTAENPMSTDQVYEKFDRNVTPVVGPEKARKLRTMVGDITGITDLRELTALTVVA